VTVRVISSGGSGYGHDDRGGVRDGRAGPVGGYDRDDRGFGDSNYGRDFYEPRQYSGDIRTATPRAPSPVRGPPRFGLEVGRVISWYEEKRFGFVQPDNGGDSIYVHLTGLIGREHLREGDIVEFERSQDSHDLKRGKERAVNVRTITPAGAGGTTRGPPDKYGYRGDDLSQNVSGRRNEGHSGGGGPFSAMPPPTHHSAPTTGYGMIDIGRVSKWNEEKGYGFIVQHGTQESIYVHRTGLRGAETLHEGDEVEFERGQETRDMEKNQDRAINVVVVGSAVGGTRATGSGYGYGDYGKGDRGKGGWDGRENSWGGAARGPLVADSHHGCHGDDHAGYFRQPPDPRGPPQLRHESGTVMSWTEEKGFGFILIDGTKESLYVHRTGLLDLQSLREGDFVTFERSRDVRDLERGRGEERAINVRLGRPVGTGGGRRGSGNNGGWAHSGGYGPGGSSGWNNGPPIHEEAYRSRMAPPSWEEPYGGHHTRSGGSRHAADGYEVGVVSAWNDEKGFGFIVKDGTQESIYVHRTGLLHAGSLNEGDFVEYARTQDARDMERGKERAVNVRVLGGRQRDRTRSPYGRR